MIKICNYFKFRKNALISISKLIIIVSISKKFIKRNFEAFKSIFEKCEFLKNLLSIEEKLCSHQVKFKLKNSLIPKF